MILGLILEKNKISLDYMGEVDNRMGKNIFMKGKVLEAKDSLYVFNSTALLPPLHIFGILMLSAMLYLNNFVFRWYVVIPLIFIISSFFRSFLWHKWIITIGLKRKGYKQKLTFLKPKELLIKVFDIE